MHEVLSSPFWDWLTLAASVIGFVAATAFVVRYQYVAGWTWWRLRDGSVNLFGRFLMTRKILLATLFAIIITNRLAPGWEARRMISAILYLLFAVHTFVPYRLITEAQRARKREAEEDDVRQ